jgi:hypothetical protein
MLHLARFGAPNRHDLVIPVKIIKEQLDDLALDRASCTVVLFRSS